MTSYQGRHRPLPRKPSEPRPPTHRAAHESEHRSGWTRTSALLGRPVMAGGLSIGLGLSAIGYAAATDLSPAAPTFVVGSGVRAQTDELARTEAVDLTYRAAASVSRNERRTAISATGLRTAVEVEAKAKAETAKQQAAAAAAAKKKAAADAEAKQKAADEAARTAAIAGAKTNPQAAARVLMADHGWTSDAQYRCLVNLWTGESAWHWDAENPSSGAYGIPQSLPASKMATFGKDYRTNPITQIKWGLWYIKASYGSPCNALSFWNSKSPHWY
ncbi:MAG: lytic transglycosylase domain-containing protein [Dermatophilaceae bacterium]